MDKKDILSMEMNELASLFAEIGEPAFRAKQVYSWLHEKNCFDWDKMTNLSKQLREKMAQINELTEPVCVQKAISAVDETSKYLFDVGNGAIIESVLMKYDYGYSACISSQAGCKMNCAFCASGMLGFDRNLTAGEMLKQVYGMQREANCRVSRVVIMGTGEPLDNLENVLSFVRILNDKPGLQIGMRHITVSTCGLIDKMNELADLSLQLTLAVSLHAPNDQIRRRIMPVSRKYTFEQLMEACRYYITKTGRRITFEYALLENVNDKDEHARELAKKLKGMLCHVNLIGANEVEGNPYRQSMKVNRFKAVLEEQGVNVTVRRKLGSDIFAACGQLRHQYSEGKEGV